MMPRAPSFTAWICFHILRARAPCRPPQGLYGPPTSFRVTSGCADLMCSTPWVGTPSACPRKILPSKHGVHPRISTERNIKRFKKQIQSLGFSYDWSREVATIEPEYYKWTQWIFLKLFKAGLAYEAVVPINWCPKDKTGWRMKRWWTENVSVAAQR